jgi:hypothetical protein
MSDTLAERNMRLHTKCGELAVALVASNEMIDRLTRERDAARAALVPFSGLSPFHPPQGVNPDQWANDVNRAFATLAP